jgi:hypothetical protein
VEGTSYMAIIIAAFTVSMQRSRCSAGDTECWQWTETCLFCSVSCWLVTSWSMFVTHHMWSTN